jgi:ABC-type phosphate transport system substrate-binding protein
MPASADPVANVYAIVGSDTLEDAVNALVNGAEGSALRTFASKASRGSFDATGSACITTKAFTKRMPRPNGSSDGVKALKASISGKIYDSTTSGKDCDTNKAVLNGHVDIARSSSTPSQSEIVTSSYAPLATEKTLAYYPFGRDAMAYAYHSASPAAFGTINLATLKDIFECTTRTLGGITVTPVIPQSGSGTRSAFINALGSSETAIREVSGDKDANNVVITDGCVVTGQEHDGRSLTGAGYIMPMSVSRWVAMANGYSFDKIGSAVIAPVSGVLTGGATLLSGAKPDVTPNANYYYNDTWGRETWLVVDYERIRPAVAPATNAAYDSALVAALNSSVEDSLTNVDDSYFGVSGYWKKKFGILPPAPSTITTGVLRVKYTF